MVHIPRLPKIGRTISTMTYQQCEEKFLIESNDFFIIFICNKFLIQQKIILKSLLTLTFLLKLSKEYQYEPERNLTEV